MPKDLGSRSFTSHRSRLKPYPSCSKGGSERGSSKEGEDVESKKEWEDAMCPICMEHPHNAILLICSSHENGCRPYICDTSYRHSNCFDQYRKAHASEKNNARIADGAVTESLSTGASNSMVRSRAEVLPINSSEGDTVDLLLGGETGSENFGSLQEMQRGTLSGRPPGLFSELVSAIADNHGAIQSYASEGRGGVSSSGTRRVQGTENPSLVCPLCRGEVNTWRVIERARQHLNFKMRNCAQEGCTFSGSYRELRKHARAQHPLARPSDVDPLRQRDWRRLERQRDIGDVLSSIRSAMPGVTTFGDYMIEDDGADPEDAIDESDLSGVERNWWTVSLLFQLFGPAPSAAGGRSFSARMRRFPRRPHFSEHSMTVRVWGDRIPVNLFNEGNRDSTNNANTEGSTSSTSRRRQTR